MSLFAHVQGYLLGRFLEVVPPSQKGFAAYMLVDIPKLTSPQEAPGAPFHGWGRRVPSPEASCHIDLTGSVFASQMGGHASHCFSFCGDFS